MDLTNKIATGKSSQVYLHEDLAFKVYNETSSKVDVLLEALNTARVEQTGLTLPTIQKVTMINNQWTLVMDYIEGPTMATLMKENPNKLEEYISKMVEVQMTIQSKQCPLLNKLKDKMKAQIKSLDCIDSIIKYEILTKLESMPKHDKICHGDFEPRNIIVSKDGYYTLDWIHATQGNASADVARTFLLLALESIETANMYMDIFCKKSGTRKQYVQQWLPIVAAAQLTKNRPEEKDLLMKWVNVVEYE